MSYCCPKSFSSTCSFLSCPSDEFKDLFENDNLSTDSLSEDALTFISRNRECLQAPKQQYNLDELLSAMIDHAPHPLGKRYVSVALYISQKKGKATMINLAKAWMEHLFLAMLTISLTFESELTSFEDKVTGTAINYNDIRDADGWKRLCLRMKVAIRERYHCAITQQFDRERAVYLREHGIRQEIPGFFETIYMETAPILPLLVANDDNNSSTFGRKISDIACTRNMFQSWTGIDSEVLGFDASSTPQPWNAIYMTLDEHISFRKFWFYLDEEAYPNSPNKYKVQMTRDWFKLNHQQGSADVEFRSLEESAVEPPSPRLLRIHAAFAKVLTICDAAKYVNTLHADESDEDLDLNEDYE